MDSRITATQPLQIEDCENIYNVYREEFQNGGSHVIIADEEFNTTEMMPGNTTLEEVKAFLRGYGKGYRNGTRNGEISLQFKIQQLLGL